ncbi:MAG: DUF4124 domain-containing protein [Rhodocyclaceae bacterium]|nr:DUF4124 domain-containing protein [Rhodocyclaceae bacterium]
MNFIHALCTALLLCAAAQTAQATVYKCRAEDGRTTFSDQPCETLNLTIHKQGSADVRAAASPAGYTAPVRPLPQTPQRPERKD